MFCSVFNHLLDDTPLPANEVSSSVLVATYLNTSTQNGKGATGGGKKGINGEVEKGLVTLISSDSSGLQVPFYCLKQRYVFHYDMIRTELILMVSIIWLYFF